MKNNYVVIYRQKMSDEDLMQWLDEMLDIGWKLLAVNADNQYIFERIIL